MCGILATSSPHIPTYRVDHTCERQREAERKKKREEQREKAERTKKRMKVSENV